MNEDKDWLDSLKVGDLVCYHDRWHGYVFEKIEKITPTKQIKTRHHTFKNGYQRGSGWDGGKTLQPITKQIIDTVKKKELVGLLKEFKFEKMDLEDLRKIRAIITDFEIAQSATESTESPSEA